MASVYDNYSSLISQLQESEKLLVLGGQLWDQILSEAGESLGGDSKGRTDKEAIASLCIHRKMTLVFGVAILESMVKDYVQYFAQCVDGTKQVDPSIPQSSSDNWVPGVSNNEKVNLPRESWKRRLRKWTQEKRKEASKETGTERNWSEAESKVEGCCVAFAHWRVLLKSVVIRNLEMHNGGVMTDRTHKHTPLCDAGEKLDWSSSKDLVCGLRLSLHSLNGDLSQLT